jgi:DNA polymerase IV (DinB-like DNA polymerase)
MKTQDKTHLPYVQTRVVQDITDEDNRISEKFVIFHVDMDHFFSAVEEREKPNIKDKPVVVGADPRQGKGRGVVKTCNYKARAYGVQSGMPISRAWTLCPHAIYLQGNYQLYKQTSKEIMKILKTYSEKFQQWGLDEAFLDMTNHVSDYDEAAGLALNIKHDILWSQQLICSVGVAPNKLVAKIASDFEKPDGLTVVEPDVVVKFLDPLPVRRLLWVGKKTEAQMVGMGMRTIGDVAVYDPVKLIEKFGSMGLRYYKFAHGIYESKVGRKGGMVKSVGHESTFRENTDEINVIDNRLQDICERVHKRIVKRGILFKTIILKIRYSNFRTYTHAKTLASFTNRLKDLENTVHLLIQQHRDWNNKIRLLGVRVTNLISNSGQATLA